MKKTRSKRQKAIIKRRIFISICAVTLIAVIAFVATLIGYIFKGNTPDVTHSETSDISSVVSKPSEPYITYSATVLSIGDIMCHDPQLKGGYVPSTSGYDFSAFFKEIKSYFDSADLAIGNLEVTFGGKESGSYKGYPAFNTPDELADNIKSAGIDLLLTANNHSYDTGLTGLKRTVAVLKDKAIDYTGTRQTADEAKYIIKQVNGIKIGIANFTYETTNKDSEAGRKYLNGIRLSTEANGLINSFSYTNIEGFYSEAESIIKDMRSNGAEFISFYMHWGDEYKLKANTWQKSIAQRLSNMGVNMIIGSHPHVVEPIELIYSEDGENTTVCVYSLGNAVSNQRRELISSCRTGHTEDGLIFTYKLDKYSDGAIVISSVDAIPTWVNKYQGGSGYLYTIYPLENENYGSEKYKFSGSLLNDTTESFKRTKEIISQGLSACQEHFGCEKRFNDDTVVQ